MRNQSCKIKKEVCITNNSMVWYPITEFEEEFSDNLTQTEILAHNRELLRQYYFATTIGKANDLLAELIKADPNHEDLYRQTLADAKKDWDELPSKERIQKYEEPAEDWIESLIRETPDANGNVREDYEYNERKEPTVADIANAIARRGENVIDEEGEVSLISIW